jgi:hypothetical protein
MAPSRWQKAVNTLRWLPPYCWQRLVRPVPKGEPIDLIFALADHFEPATVPGPGGRFADLATQEQRLERWSREYPKLVRAWPDSDGRPFRHTYFYPAEQYERGIVQRLVEHCRAGWGEIELHLHHGVEAPDTADNLRRVLVEFRNALAEHGCLSRLDGDSMPRYAFVHGNFALANSRGGRFCGVDNEMQVLAETGCYADFTLPSAPLESQVAKINAIYECTLPLEQAVPHRLGRDLRRGHTPRFPLIVQGPLGLRLRGKFPFVGVENGDIATANPPSPARIQLWRRAAVQVKGEPNWTFIKLHCHGMAPKDEVVMLGPLMMQFLRDLDELCQADRRIRVHFVSAREMTNIILAACDGCSGNPCEYRDRRLRLSV